MSKKVKNNVPWTYVINDLIGEEIVGTFYKKELQKANQNEFRIEKVIKRKGSFTFSDSSGYGRNVIIFSVDMSSSAHVVNKKKDILILGKGPTQGLDDTRLTAEKKILSKFTS